MVSRCSFLASARIRVVSKETRCQTTWRVRRTLTFSTSRKSPRPPTKTPKYSRLTICSLSAWVPALDGPLDCLRCSAGVSPRLLPASGPTAYPGRAVPFTVGQTSRSERAEAVGRPAAASAAGHGRRVSDQVEHEYSKRMVFDPCGGIRRPVRLVENERAGAHVAVLNHVRTAEEVGQLLATHRVAGVNISGLASGRGLRRAAETARRWGTACGRRHECSGMTSRPVGS